eukprot:2556926-Prymnesium_polylepis.1
MPTAIEMGSAGSTFCRMGSSARVAQRPASTASAQTTAAVAEVIEARPTRTWARPDGSGGPVRG